LRAASPAPDKFDLKMVQRRDIGKAMPDGAGQSRVVREVLPRSHNFIARLDGSRPFRFQRLEYAGGKIAIAAVANGVAKSVLAVTFGGPRLGLALSASALLAVGAGALAHFSAG